MRAPVAAQDSDYGILLLKSLSQTTVWDKSWALAFDKAVLPKRCKDLIDSCAALGIYNRPGAGPCNCGASASHNLCSAYHDGRAAEGANLP